MTMVFTEGDLQIIINNAINARKFDDPSHGLSHCMKAVDFIIELSDQYLFIEFKDPQHPRSTPEAGQVFFDRFDSGILDEELKYKYRDSFLYEWAAERANKPIHYAVLIAHDNLSSGLLQRRTDELKRKLPTNGATSLEPPDSAGLCRVQPSLVEQAIS